MYADDFDGVSKYNNNVYESKCHTNNTISLAKTTIDIAKKVGGCHVCYMDQL